MKRLIKWYDELLDIGLYIALFGTIWIVIVAVYTWPMLWWVVIVAVIGGALKAY